MTLRELAARAAQQLHAAGIPDAPFEAEYLARSAAGVSRAAYFAGAAPAPGDEERIATALRRRLAREPAAYITGAREFYGRAFAVGPAVLVPRPETGLLVELALAALREHPGALVADVGTGSGCVAVSVAAEAPAARVAAVDVSAGAIAIAAANAARHAPQVHLLRGDLASPLRAAGIVVANLPYVPAGEIDALEPEVSRWEPRVALDGGRDGLDLVRRLLADCATRLRPALLALELGAGQAATVAPLATAAGAGVQVIPDLARIDRVVCARWQQ